MNGYQRIQAVLKGEWPDRRPVMLHNFMAAAREAGMTQAQYRSSPENIARAHIEAAERYDLDGVLIDVDTATMAGALGVPVDYPEDEPARCHGQLLTRLADIGRLMPVDISKNERIAIWLEACRLVKKHFGDEILVRGNCDQLPFSVAAMIRTPQEWLMDLMAEENEKHVFALLDYAMDACSRFVRLMADTGVHMISHGDSPSGPDMISPAMYRKYALPYQRGIAALSHSLGKPHMLHICGSTEAILGDMLETGSDAFELDYKTDVRAIRRIHGDRVVLSGNIDPSGVLALGTPELVAKQTRALIEAYCDSPRLVVCSGCALPPVTPEKNLRVMIGAVRA